MNTTSYRSDFQSWVNKTFEQMAAQYRATCNAVVRTCHEYAAGNNWEPRHTATGISCLPERPVMPKYPGVVTTEDREWYAYCLKPQWEDMRTEAEGMIKQLEQSKPRPAEPGR